MLRKVPTILGFVPHSRVAAVCSRTYGVVMSNGFVLREFQRRRAGSYVSRFGERYLDEVPGSFQSVPLRNFKIGDNGLTEDVLRRRPYSLRFLLARTDSVSSSPSGAEVPRRYLLER